MFCCMFDWHPGLKRRATITADNATRLKVAFTVDLTYGTLIQVMVSTICIEITLSTYLEMCGEDVTKQCSH